MNNYSINNPNIIFEQAAQITKAHAYDILVSQRNELQTENAFLKDRVKYLEDLIKEYTDKMLMNISALQG